MTDALKVLGQVKPSGLETLYAVPLGKSATLSSVVACNHAAQATTFDVAVAVGGAEDAEKQYLYREQVLPANQSFVATVGLTLAAADMLRVRSANSQVSFNAFGVEIT